VHRDAVEGPVGPRHRHTAGAQPVKEPRPRKSFFWILLEMLS
jgi:hypothetical protein